jgi:UDP-glucose 4-epimerase
MAEDFPLAPCDTYGISKQANEHQLDVWVDRSGGSGRIARIFNVVGRDDPNGHLVPDLLTRLAAAARGPRPFRLELGALTPARDYLHIEDAADGLKMLADDRSADRLAAYNLCRGQPVSVADLARRLMDLTGIDAELVSREAHLRRRDRPMLWGDPGLTRAKLGWQAGHSLEDALRDIIAAHPDFSRTPA